jgi:hypothetical protein
MTRSKLAAGGDGYSELDVEVLRVAVFHERWQCLGEEGCALDPAHAAPLSEAPRMAPATLRGDWKVFDVSAVPIEETDVETGAAGLVLASNTASMWDYARAGGYAAVPGVTTRAVMLSVEGKPGAGRRHV